MRYTFGIAHRAIKDTKLCGYDIPKDTMVIGMSSGMLTDEKYIKNPYAFDPENFLDENCKLTIPEKHFPFGVGKHRCIGEMLAKGNIFLLCTSLLQNFSLEIPHGHEIPSTIPIDGATPTVQDYSALIVARN